MKFLELIFIFLLTLDKNSPTQILIKNFGDYKAWEDGTFSISCEEYRYPPRFYSYKGEVDLLNSKFEIFLKNGSGVYKIATTNYKFNAYCNME